MRTLNQKEATFMAVISVCGHKDGAYDPTDAEYDQIVNILVEGFNQGAIALSSPQSDIRKYVVGLVNNWLRKDERLNGGVKYMAKHPGSRQGVGDAQLKALKSLLAITVDFQERAEIQGYIDARVAELAKAKQPTVNFDALPAELRAKCGK